MNDVKIATDCEIRAAYLTAPELKLAASLIYQAYHDDPVFIDIFSGSGDYEQKLRASIREELAAFWQAKQPILGIYLGEALVGVACLHSPAEGFGSNRFWHWRLKMMLSAGYVSTKQMIQKEEQIIEAVPMDCFHILSFIAIHPLHQHHGFGHYLMAAVNAVFEDETESEGVAIYVTSDKYKEFFKECDYDIIKEITVGNVTGPLMVHYKDS
ncbi:GNAT family N-acetyltransferase [Thalassotalea psychrophila]|uniref:GNAT family N-acetyltransferase n=1 Tax=Thalassotalea psychrophila TaxID=3065647 RepID=A0ABY9TYT3_9GAMM|nr:GNAT family N-acetyltransferase [Colwelliaceae bacterium SQ149]